MALTGARGQKSNEKLEILWFSKGKPVFERYVLHIVFSLFFPCPRRPRLCRLVLVLFCLISLLFSRLLVSFFCCLKHYVFHVDEYTDEDDDNEYDNDIEAGDDVLRCS